MSYKRVIVQLLLRHVSTKIRYLQALRVPSLKPVAVDELIFLTVMTCSILLFVSVVFSKIHRKQSIFTIHKKCQFGN